MLVYQRFVSGLAIASYVVGDEKTGEAVIIDPTRDVHDYLAYTRDNDLHITHVLETHVHADYVCGSRELKQQLGGEVTLHCSGEGGDEWTPRYADKVTRDGDEIRIGGARLKAIHTPGHTPEHLSWALYEEARSSSTPSVIFTGDFLFVGDVGRPDLLGKETQERLAHQLYESVFERLPAWPDIAEIFPGHGAGSLCGKAISSRRSSTVGYERQFNGSLVHKPEATWVADLLKTMPLAPPYFRRMKHVNKHGPRVIGSELPGQRRRTATQVHERVCDECLVVDLRAKEAFSAAHIPGSINIPFGPALSTWAGWVLPYDRPILLVLDEPSRMGAAAIHLLRVGLDDVQGYLEGGIDAWETAGYELSTLTTLSAHDLGRELTRAPGSTTVLDVRTEREWNSGHIDGAIHVHGGQLQDRFGDVPRDRPVAVVCGSGFRGSIAASFLQREGYERVSNVMGGMSAWKAIGLPTITRS